LPALLVEAAHRLGFGLPGKPWTAWVLALLASGLAGQEWWKRVLETWSDQTLLPSWAMGIIVSILVMLAMFKFLELIHESFLNHASYGWEARLGTMGCALVALTEMAAVGYTLYSQDASLLNPLAGVLAVVGGALVTVINFASANHLARTVVRSKAAHAEALVMLQESPRKERLDQAFALHQLLRAQAQAELEAPRQRRWN
jgi:hypothetical protein